MHGSYGFDEETETSPITFDELDVRISLGPHAETYSNGLTAHEDFYEQMHLIFTTEPLLGLDSVVIPESIRPAIDVQAKEKGIDFFDADYWMENANVKSYTEAGGPLEAYITTIDGEHYFSGSNVDWSTGCFSLATATYITGDENTAWFLKESVSLIFLRLCFIPEDDNAAAE